MRMFSHPTSNQNIQPVLQGSPSLNASKSARGPVLPKSSLGTVREGGEVTVAFDTIGYESFGNLYLNITNRCSASCLFCIRHYSDGVYGYNLRLSRKPSEEEILRELESLDLAQYKEVVFTGFGEPTCRFDALLRLTEWLSKKGLHVRLDTNGDAALMSPGRDVVTELKTAGLDAVSVSLNAESEGK